MEAEPDRGADGDHQGEHEQVADGVGGGAAGQDAQPAIGQRAEPVDHPGGQVFGDGHAGLGGAERDGSTKARQQVVDVMANAGGWMAPPKA